MSRERRASAAWALAAAAGVAFGCASALRFVGASNLAGGDAAVAPIAHDDFALQFYYGRLGGELLREHGVTWGYDPRFMAGYPKTPIYYPSSKPFELVLAVFGAADPARAFNWCVFALTAALPLLAWAAAAGFGLPPPERALAVAMSAVPHLLVPIAGFFPFMEAAGMTSFVFAASLSVCVVALARRFLSDGSRAAGAALAIAAPALLLCHPAAGLLVALPLSTLYLARLRRTPWRRHLWLWLVALGAVLANGSWIVALLRFAHYADVGDFYTPGGQQHFAVPGGWLAPLRAGVPSPWPLALVPPIFGAIGLGLWWRERRWELLRIFAPQIAFLFALAYYGPALGLSVLGPARLTLPLGLYLLFPAAHGLAAAGAGLWRRGSAAGSGRRVRGLRTAAALLGIAAVAASGLHERAFRPYSVPRLQAESGYERHARGLLAWLAATTDGRGRLLHEETDRHSHRYYGSHLAALIPHATGRELAGGPAPHALLAHNSLRFAAGTLGGRALRSVPRARVTRLLSLYNVRWVLCWSPVAKRYFERHPEVARVGTYDRFSLYRVEREPSWFLRGRGRVAAATNRIELSDLVPESGVVTLKYHWLESLRTDPPREIRPSSVPEDPVPFISVVDPPARLVIYQDYDAARPGASAGAGARQVESGKRGAPGRWAANQQWAP